MSRTVKDYILERYTPSVLVLATAEAEAICQEKNGVSVVDLLRPFGFFHHLSVPVRIVGEQPYRIKEFRLRFYGADTMVQPSMEVAAEHLKAVLTATAEQTGVESNVDLLSALRKGELPEQTPWFNDFKHEFMRMLMFSDLDTLDQPVACLLVAHSHADDVLKAFTDLYSAAKLSPSLKTGMTDGKILKHYLLIHDSNLRPPGGIPWAEEKLRALRERLGEKACNLVQLNSREAGGKGSPYEGLFRSHMQLVVPGGGGGEPASHATPPSQGLGALLTEGNVQSITTFLEEFSTRSLLPNLEARVRLLHQQVTATRKGVRNQLKNLLWRSKGSASEAPRAGGVDMSLGGQTVEGQLRSLADLAFLMQDYDTCSSTLRLLASDLKADKEWRHYAAVQEMQGLAAIMTGAPASEVIAFFRDAFSRFDLVAGRSGRDARRYATRSQLLLADFCCQGGLYGEANAALMRAQSQEENLIAAVLLEQAALSLLHTSPPAVRKWAFHLVLAALRFSNCQQPRLANRAYRQVLGVFEDRRWGHIDGHLQDMLGRHASETGDFAAAASHYAATLSCPESHPHRQRHLLQQFLDSLQKLTPQQLDSLASELPLPEVDTEHVNVTADDAITFANADAISYPEAFWKSMAAPLLAGQEMGGGGPTWLEGGSRASLAEASRRTAVAGEEIGLDLDIHNPLIQELRITHLQACVEAPAPDSFKAEEEEVVLRGGERMRVRLRIRGLKAGPLSVTGVSWQLEGAAPGRKILQLRQLPQPRARGAGSEAESKAGLAFNIIPEMPRLQVEMRGLEGEEPVYAGEVVRCVARLHNAGSVPLKSLRLLVAQPELLCCTSPALLTTQLTSLSDFVAREEGAGVQGSLARGGGRVYQWPSDLTIPAGGRLEWPFFLHPTQAGRLPLHCLWQYEPATPDSTAGMGMPSRLLRWSQTVDVLPLLDVRAQVLASPAHLSSYLLKLQATSTEEAGPVKLLEVGCSSDGWQVRSVAASNTQPCASAELGTLLTGPSCTAVCQLFPPDQQASAPGPEWLADGSPISHFHSDRKRLSRATGRESVPDGRAVEERTLEGSSVKQVVALSPEPSSIASRAQSSDDASFVLGWALEAGKGQPNRLGILHLIRVPFQDDSLTSAVVEGERSHRWDFSQGPCHVSLLLKVCNRRKMAASLCCETGTTLDLAVSDAERAEARRWHVHVPGSPSPSQPGGSGAQTPAARPAPTPQGTPRTSGASLPAGGTLLPAGPLSSPGHIWVGQTRAGIPHLRPGDVAEVPLQMLFFKPGVVQVTDYALFWTFPDGSMNKAHLGPPILITISSQ